MLRFFSQILKPWLKKARQRPFLVFVLILFILTVLLVIGRFLREPEVVLEQPNDKPTQVTTYQVGSAPMVLSRAKVEKSGVVTIVAQTAGVVEEILVNPGQALSARQPIARLATNYSGGNVAGLQLQLARIQQDHLEQTHDLQKDLIKVQREVAFAGEANTTELREITKKTIGDSEDLLELNESIIDELDDQLSVATDSAFILQTKQLKAQLKQANIGLKSQLDQARYQSDSNAPPADLARAQKEATLHQLEIQERALALNKEVASLQTKIAQVQAASMLPATPFAAKVERVHTSPGLTVQPGTPLATVSTDQLTTRLIALVSADIASSIVQHEKSNVFIPGGKVSLYPDYVSTQPTDGQMYSVQFTLSHEQAANLGNRSYINVELPVGSPDTSASIPFVPLDAVYQTEKTASVLVAQDGIAVLREVELGPIFGSYVEVRQGLQSGDGVILNRSVLTGQKVIVK